MSIQNESHIPVPYDTMHVDPEEFAIILREMYTRFQREGLKTLIVAPENNGPRFTPADSDTISHILPILEDDELRPMLGRITTHQATSPAEMLALTELGRKYGKKTWQTEHHLGNIGGGGMPAAMELARDLFDGVVLGRVNAYFTWCFAWIPDQKKTQGLIWIDPNDPTRYLLKKTYFAFRQYAKFIPAGSVMIYASNDGPGLLSGAFVKDGQVTIVVINDLDRDHTQVFRLPGIKGKVQVYRTSVTEDCAQLEPIKPSTGGFTDLLPKQSVTTYVARL